MMLAGCSADSILQAPISLSDGSLLVWHTWPQPEAALLEDLFARYDEITPDVRLIVEYVPSSQLTARFEDQAGAGTMDSPGYR